MEGLKLVAKRPQLVKYACNRFAGLCMKEIDRLAVLGPAGIWIQDSFSNMINPKSYEFLVVPSLRQVVEAAHRRGLSCILYFCGNPKGKLEQMLTIGADALSVEEGKKGFVNDIGEITAKVRGRATLLGNLDSIGVLQNGTNQELQAEIRRQLKAGRRNEGRFIMSLGSPVTPGTSAQRVRLYCGLSRELASKI
jgi:uroporphyrinogen-III decarboxylase